MEIYKPKNFILEELVPKDVFELKGIRSWEILNPKILMSIQELREFITKPIRLNDWKFGGKRHNQVFRKVNYYGGISYSQHLFGNAVDADCDFFSAEELRQIVIDMKRLGKLKYVTGIEDGVNWLHIDCRPCERLDIDGLFHFDK